jgi:glyoxylase-like metal-dependent hydrolase (beta-lactamase superfamily II)
MFFESVRTERGCVSYVIGCEKTRAALLVDPDLAQADRYLALASSHGLRLHYLLDTHTTRTTSAARACWPAASASPS